MPCGFVFESVVMTVTCTCMCIIIVYATQFQYWCLWRFNQAIHVLYMAKCSLMNQTVSLREHAFAAPFPCVHAHSWKNSVSTMYDLCMYHSIIMLGNQLSKCSCPRSRWANHTHFAGYAWLRREKISSWVASELNQSF